MFMNGIKECHITSMGHCDLDLDSGVYLISFEIGIPKGYLHLFPHIDFLKTLNINNSSYTS